VPETDRVFAGSIPETYDRCLVPLIFEDFAQDISQTVAALSPRAVLETAAGSGVVTRAVAPLLSPNARYVVTDLNQPMLDYAAARQTADNRIDWQKADAQALPFEDAAFDLVCCQFGVMFSRPPSRLPRGEAGSQARRKFRIQRMGSHRGECVRRRCNERARGSFPG
jgi:ubiquinone/menaquinone biosynthesis C-methylase UbiE